MTLFKHLSPKGPTSKHHHIGYKGFNVEMGEDYHLIYSKHKLYIKKDLRGGKTKKTGGKIICTFQYPKFHAAC